MRELEKLENRFQRCMSLHSNSNKAYFTDLWEKIIQAHHNRPYHNLKLAFGDLCLTREIESGLICVSEELVMAVLFRHFDYHPKSGQNSLEKSINYMAYTLESVYGWRSYKVTRIAKLIRASHSLLVPSREEDFQESLIRDMKMARLAKPYKEFIADRDCLAKEFMPHFPLKDIMRTEYLIFKGLQKRDELFYTGICQNFAEKVKENLGKRLIDLTPR